MNEAGATEAEKSRLGAVAAVMGWTVTPDLIERYLTDALVHHLVDAVHGYIDSEYGGER